MTFRVICENTSRNEYADQPLMTLAVFGTPGHESGKLISGSEVDFLLRSTEIDKLGWIKAGQEYEIEIRPVTL